MVCEVAASPHTLSSNSSQIFVLTIDIEEIRKIFLSQNNVLPHRKGEACNKV